MNKIKEILFKKRKINYKILAVLIAVSVIFTSLTVYGNYKLDVEYIDLKNYKIPTEFNGFKIAHVSDFHNRESDSFSEIVVSVLKEIKPDVIVITGDLIDQQRTNTKTALAFASSLVRITKVYYVTGNHETAVKRRYPILYNDYLKKIRDLGVCVLSNEAVKLFSGDSSINLCGMDEIYDHVNVRGELPAVTDKFCKEFNININEFNILLAHHPEQIDVYSKYGFDVVYSGHAHAGQFRIFGKGILAPDQGFFPEYTSGLYNVNNTKLILSRGLGNSSFPFRISNKPHLIITELKK